MKEETITITLEEYKELLMIKGKYEELKSLYVPTTYPKITYRNFEGVYNPMKDDKGMEI